MREGGQRVQTSSYEMGKSWKRDVLHACCCLVAQSWCPTLQPHGLQHARLPCPSPSPLQNCPGTIVNSTALYVWKLTRADLKILTTRNKICTNVRWWMLAYCGDHLTGKKKKENHTLKCYIINLFAKNMPSDLDLLWKVRFAKLRCDCKAKSNAGKPLPSIITFP